VKPPKDLFRAYIAPIHAISGSGGHNSCFSVACHGIHGFCLPLDEVKDVMMEWNQTHTGGEPFSESMIDHKIRDAANSGSSKPRGYLLNEGDIEASSTLIAQRSQPLTQSKPRPKWPELDQPKVIDLIRNHPVRVSEFNAISPMPTEEANQPGIHLPLLYGQGETKDPWICIGWDFRNALTRRLSEWKDHSYDVAPQFIVPNPMKGESGIKTDREPSPRALSNVLSRRFIVIETDFTKEKHQEIFHGFPDDAFTVHDLCATILVELARFAPLIMAVNSGGKSIHGWFPANVEKRIQYNFFRTACSLGADPALANLNQWSRYPAGIRTKGGTFQKVEYFNTDSQLLNF